MTAQPHSVRLALPSEAAGIAAVQRRAWTQLYAEPVAAQLLDSTDLAAMTQAWEAAIRRPPLATLRVLVAVDSSQGSHRVVGFAAVGPSDDPDANPAEDGLVAEFAIDPLAQRLGHGSRLLQACADTLRADGFIRASWWVRASDDPLRAFLTGAGWAPDGAHTELGSEDDASGIKFVRLHTDISAARITPAEPGSPAR
ncbi:MAG: GNAT family N-acetyltransferase [Actinobacteria bacterium]|nr:GNAT family N-acetyltransferase [Actinomycetota bacterium]